MHPEAVLWLSETEALLMFQSMAEIMAATHLFGAALAWCNETIRLHIHPLINTQVRKYVAAKGRCPPAPKHRSWVRDWLPGLPIVSHPERGPLPRFHMALRDLSDAHLWQPMEDLWQEVVQRELTAPP